ncbi:MAG: Rrf2 family transcriptional regulator [Ignavibacteriota bacterium]|nr:MAG: Rrf2 family transcriptional regulator [Ignavibacterium sp.]MBL1154110.1 Rrf2 family transcriptional regulator [Ignavibacteriota bacterium]MCO6446049.1 Rrf2 family transcriptional regulator [Ignavibacterium album]MCZ2267471.1 Rrf2 family transcriptional regulator [Ignavibacteriales bacterium]MBW7843136.1 Rrf2 family transcriptional regulator [Ignavibacterium sp.]
MASFFSKKCEYGLQAVIYLASKQENRLCSAKEISEELNIPKEFISKILQDLTDKGIIFSRKGRDGGFKLAINADEIKLIDIIKAVDGLDIFKRCILGFHNCKNFKKCFLQDEWQNILNQTYNMLSNETVGNFRERIYHT